MEITWNLRMVAAKRDVWTGAQLRKVLRDRAGYPLSSASISELLTGTPRQVKITTLAALCVALDCEPGDLLVAVPADQTAADAARVDGPAVQPEAR
jgi:DNA-binding Xre family transcriptional regulator